MMFALALLAVCGACGTLGLGAKGPHLAPGPLPPLGSAAASPRAGAPEAVPAFAAATSREAGIPAPRSSAGGELPTGLIASGGLGRLPGASVSGIGPVHGLVVSVSLDGRVPSRDRTTLIAEVLGGGSDDTGATVAKALSAASGGKFRLTFSVLPGLVESRRSDQLVEGTRIRALAAASLRSWRGQIDLGGFDNDGADGIAGSADDDGVLDFFLMAVEADQEVPSVTVRSGMPVGGAKRGQSLSTGAIHVLGLSRSGGDPLIAGIGLVLDAAGLDADERFFPSGFPRMISSIARVRLGWIPTRVLQSGVPRTDLAVGEAVLIPLRDVPAGGGFWLLENDGRHTYATRAVRTQDDHFSPTDVRVWAPGRPLVLPLTRQMGELGERAVVRGAGAPEVHLEGMPAEEPAGPASSGPVRW